MAFQGQSSSLELLGQLDFDSEACIFVALHDMIFSCLLQRAITEHLSVRLGPFDVQPPLRLCTSQR